MVKRCVNGQMCSPDNAFFLTLNCSVKYMANKSYIAIFSYLGTQHIQPTRPQKLRKSIVKFTSDMKKSIRKSNIKYALDS